ncbi:MAG: hypothetical protein HYX80_01845 [Chloroflexi bacterium]|nr:hypothetical protein [Chloroflexota bacterium]
MASIILTETNPVVMKAAGGGGSQSSVLTDTSPIVAKAAGGGGSQSAVLTETSPVVLRAAGGGGRQTAMLTDWPPALPKPTVSTDPPTGVGVTSTTLNGYLDDDGGFPSECAFEWGRTESYGRITPVQDKRAGERFSQVLTDLEADTTYHFRALASNGFGLSYGNDRVFKTLSTRTPPYFQGPFFSLLEGDIP